MQPSLKVGMFKYKTFKQVTKYAAKGRNPTNEKRWTKGGDMREAQVGRFSRSCVLNASPGCGTKSYNGDCAYANGFPVLAEGLGVVIIRTSATNGTTSFCEEEIWTVVRR
jgi:hypothetical protein